MTNIAMENPNHKWRFLAGNIIYKWAATGLAGSTFGAQTGDQGP